MPNFEYGLKPLAQQLDPAVCQKAARYAVRVFEEMSKRSQLLKQEGQVAQFEREEILPHLGELLGKGGFNSVYELERVQLIHDNNNNNNNNNNTDPTQRQQRQDVANSKSKLAVKFLSDEALASPDEFCNGAADLLMEAKYLTALAAHPHPSLITLHGVCRAGPAGFERVQRAGFFLVIDRLYDTLDRRIDVWKEVQRRHQQHHVSSSSSNNNNNIPTATTSATTTNTITTTNTSKLATGLLLQRLLVAQDIASALRHLHKLQIIFRDLKPDNVGFCYSGQVKLFDFGLAKELDPMQRSADTGLYQMSGGTGSRRFMAPEIARSERYGLSADLYSFGVLVWEVLALEKAFGRMSVDEHRERVVKGYDRLELSSSSSSSSRCGMIMSPLLQSLLEGCWSRNPFARPTAKEAYKMLRQEIQDIVAQEFPKQQVV